MADGGGVAAVPGGWRRCGVVVVSRAGIGIVFAHAKGLFVGRADMLHEEALAASLQ
jgi:hypothetical protein